MKTALVGDLVGGRAWPRGFHRCVGQHIVSALMWVNESGASTVHNPLMSSYTVKIDDGRCAAIAVEHHPDIQTAVSSTLLTAAAIAGEKFVEGFSTQQMTCSVEESCSGVVRHFTVNASFAGNDTH